MINAEEYQCMWTCVTKNKHEGGWLLCRGDAIKGKCPIAVRDRRLAGHLKCILEDAFSQKYRLRVLRQRLGSEVNKLVNKYASRSVVSQSVGQFFYASE